MKLNKLVIGGGVLVVLLSMLVVGCKGLGSGDEDVKKEGAKKLTWDTTNSDATYKRFFQQFGNTSYNLVSGTVKLNMQYPQYGKAGIVFGLTENDVGETKTVNYYQFGLGEQIGSDGKSTGKLQYYLDYYVGVDPTKISVANGSEYPTVEPTEIVPLTLVDSSKFPHSAGAALECWIDLSYNKESDKYTITFGPTETTRGSISFTQAKTHKEISPTTSAQGPLGAYGMVRPGNKGTTNAKNVYEVTTSKPTIVLSAEDAE